MIIVINLNSMNKLYKPQEVSKQLGISVRTLQYYDQIGLLQVDRDQNNNQTYSTSDLLILQQILYFKQLGFELKIIKQIITKDKFNQEAAFRAQLSLMEQRRRDLDKIIEQLKSIINSQNLTMRTPTPKDINHVEEFQRLYENEARHLYQDTKPYNEFTNKKLSGKQLAQAMLDGNQIFQEIGNLMDTIHPKDPQVQELVQKWQQHITTNYYACTDEILASLGKLYIQDQRFTHNIDKHRIGLAKFLSEAIEIYTTKT